MRRTNFSGILRFKRIIESQLVDLINQKKKKRERERICRIVDFADPADDSVKVEEIVKTDK